MPYRFEEAYRRRDGGTGTEKKRVERGRQWRNEGVGDG